MRKEFGGFIVKGGRYDQTLQIQILSLQIGYPGRWGQDGKPRHCGVGNIHVEGDRFIPKSNGSCLEAWRRGVDAGGVGSGDIHPLRLAGGIEHLDLPAFIDRCLIQAIHYPVGRKQKAKLLNGLQGILRQGL